MWSVQAADNNIDKSIDTPRNVFLLLYRLGGEYNFHCLLNNAVCIRKAIRTCRFPSSPVPGRVAGVIPPSSSTAKEHKGTFVNPSKQFIRNSPEWWKPSFMLSFELTFHFCHQSQFHRAKETSYVTFLFTINYHTLSNSVELDYLIFNSTNDISYERKHKFQLSVIFLGERVRDTPNLNPVNSQ